jgi:hypothetical protein
MKKILLVVSLVVLFFAPATLFAQVKEEEKPKEPQTKLEAFIAKKGKLIIRDRYRLGELRKLGAVRFNALVFYEPGMESQRIKGVSIEITEGGRVERSRTSFLDLDEIESVSKAIQYMIDLANKWKGQTREYTEVTFSTRGEFKIGFYQGGEKIGVYLNTGYVAHASCFMEVQDFPELKSIFDKGLSLLNQK